MNKLSMKDWSAWQNMKNKPAKTKAEIAATNAMLALDPKIALTIKIWRRSKGLPEIA